VPWKTHTRSRTLPHPTADPAEIATIATELLDRFGPPAPVRLIGVGVSSLEAPVKGESDPARAPTEENAAESLTLELS
jgi:DNA polymerase IV